jgi:prepilin-type N-terminal cleavage/methylation domain-containing protein/prepilin-type processing-associated H-X9-DG protein
MNTYKKPGSCLLRSSSIRAFTLVELLVVIALIGILAGSLLTTLSKVKIQTQSVQCKNNLNQFALAWSAYNFDNSDRVPPNNCCDNPGGDPSLNTWVHGWIPLGQNQSDDTNILMLTASLLGPYVGQSVKVWRCPSDGSTSVQGGQVMPRVRSISMNSWLNVDQDLDLGIWGFPTAGGYIIRKISDMIHPGPSNTFVFTDERADSIDDGCFGVSMYARGDIATMENLPGNYHAGGGNFSFADGHSELHKWTDPRSTPPLSNNWNPGGYPAPNDPDIAWLQDHSTARRW